MATIKSNKGKKVAARVKNNEAKHTKRSTSAQATMRTRSVRHKRQQRRAKARPIDYLIALLFKSSGIMATEASPLLACWVAYLPATAIPLSVSAVLCLGVGSYRLWAEERNQ